jgi:DNA adenine methylase
LNSTEAVTKRTSNQRTNKRNDLIQPFLKWAGGKRQLLPEIRKYIPKKYNIYFEPFIGAGAVLFDIQPQEAIINDANAELINCYNAIKTDPEGVIRLAQEHQRENSEKYFYSLRSLDREASFKELSSIKRAARIIYLNKTCYNGLFRVNSQGQFNVPYGNYQDPQVVDALVIRAVSRYLNEVRIDISQGDFEDAVSGATAGDFVYFDPPYDPLSDTSSFTGYNLINFDKPQQEQLKKVCDELTGRGCMVLLSNSDTLFIRDLYSDTTRYTIKPVVANRNINSVSTGRGKISELLIYNNYNVEQIKE